MIIIGFQLINKKIMKKKIYAMIPARIGSSRLKIKNLAFLNGKPLIYYAIKAAKESGVFDKIIIMKTNWIFQRKLVIGGQIHILVIKYLPRISMS